MKFLLRQSIARRIFLSLLFACALAWVAIYGLGLYLVSRANSGNFDREMLTLADTLGAVVQRHPQPAELSIALSALAASIDSQARVLRLPAEFQNFHVRSADGASVARSAAALDAHLGEADQTGFFSAKRGDKTYRVYAFWSADRKYRIELTQSVASRRQAFDYVMMSREGLLFPLLVGFPFLLIPIWIAVRLGLRPVSRLSEELAARAPGDLKPINVPHVDAELVPLVRELDGTLLRLRELLQRERGFLADAAHEMRTPLALIAAQVDNLSLAQEPQHQALAMQRLQTGVDRCSRLVNQLLSLARLEANADGQIGQIDVADAVRECLATHAHEANAREISISYEGPDHHVLALPRQALESVLDNLVSNAVRYVQRGGRVLVTLAEHPGPAVRLCISDDGPGIAVQDRVGMFERFRRGSSVTAVGSGLGLAIAAAAARRFGARIDVGEGLDGRGVSFAMQWQPAHTASEHRSLASPA